MKIHFIIKTNRNVDREILNLSGHRENGVYLIVNTRLAQIEKESINDVAIYGHNEKKIIEEMDSQISDGLFENDRVEILEIIKESEIWKKN